MYGNVEFCGKTSMFLPKNCLFIFFIFYLNEKELTQQICLIKYVTLPLTKKQDMSKASTWSNFKRINSKTPEKLSLVTLVTNYHKLSLLPLLVRPCQKFEKQNKCWIFNLVIVTSNKLYFDSLHELNFSHTLKFCYKFS